MLLKNQCSSIISTYTADVSGVCSALFEFGGMTVMHDASGCNSTYNTHDEPRWYHMDSMVFISAISEMEAIMGDDGKLISDIVKTAKELNPEFIALAGTPIPMMIGTDFSAIARMLEEKTGIPAFGIDTNGMHSYVSGASKAFCQLAHRFSKKSENKKESVNIIGTTPLDFSVSGYEKSLEKLLLSKGYEIYGKFGMGGSLSGIEKSGAASCSLVVSASGFMCAKFLYESFGVPYTIGSGENVISAIEENKTFADSFTPSKGRVIIGDAVISRRFKEGKIICPPDTPSELLTEGIETFTGENNLREILKSADEIIADPLFKPICPKNAKFIPMPHEAFSGRIYRNQIKNILEENYD